MSMFSTRDLEALKRQLFEWSQTPGFKQETAALQARVKARVAAGMTEARALDLEFGSILGSYVQGQTHGEAVAREALQPPAEPNPRQK